MKALFLAAAVVMSVGSVAFAASENSEGSVGGPTGSGGGDSGTQGYMAPSTGPALQCRDGEQFLTFVDANDSMQKVLLVCRGGRWYTYGR